MSVVCRKYRKVSETRRSFKQTSSVIKGLDSVMKRTHIKNSTESEEVTYPPIVEQWTLT